MTPEDMAALSHEANKARMPITTYARLVLVQNTNPILSEDTQCARPTGKI